MNDSFAFYRSWAESLEEDYADDEDTLKDIYVAIIRYGIYGKKSFPAEKTLLKNIFAQIDIAQETRKRNAANGRLGGMSGTGESKARYGNKNASKKKDSLENTQAQLVNTQPNVNVNWNGNGNSHVNGNGNGNGNENLHVNAVPYPPSGTATPDRGGPSVDGTEDDWEWEQY